MKGIWKKLILLIIGIALVLSPFSAFLLVAHFQKPVYTKTFYAALIDKCDNLGKNKEKKKLVLIGGSNVAFGFDGDTLKQYFKDYEIVNFGLYAMLGTKIMMDLALDSISKNDIVCVIPEINSQSMSLYFSPESTLKALEENYSLISKLENDDREKTFGKYFSFVCERAAYTSLIDPGETVYKRENFNQYGDIHYVDKNDVSLRSKNIMPLHYDPSLLVDYGLTVDSKFLNYLSKYNESITKKGAKLYYSWSPVNNLSVVDDNNFADLYWTIREKANIEVIGNPDNYIIDNHYFYDSNFHLNDNGAVLRSLKFVEDYHRDVLFKSLTLEEYYPSEPEYENENIDVSVNSETADLFNYVEVDDKLEIVGTNNDLIEENEIALPSVANHKVIAGIGKNAFSDSKIESIVIPETIRYIRDKAFNNSEIKTVKLMASKPSTISVSWQGGLLDGARDDMYFYVDKNSYSSFMSDYYWGPYGERIKTY